MRFTQMLGQAYRTIFVFLGAQEKLAMAGDNLATVAQETTATYVDETRAERRQKALELQKKLEAIEAE